MVKRVKTPEPGDDEPKIFTVVNPYPLHANWEYDEDYITCARWLAAILGTDAPLFAIHHKPSARGMILIEVDKTFDRDRILTHLLGEHKWSQFLYHPAPQEVEQSTKIYYSLYSIVREAQKDGWKRIHIQDQHFHKYESRNSVVRFPYPETSWCPLIQEDRTQKTLCRPLPKDHPKTPILTAPPPAVPGSSDWVKEKRSPQPKMQQGPQGAWGKKPPTITARPIQQPQRTATKPNPAPPQGKVAPKSAWTQPITPANAKPGYAPNNPKAWSNVAAKSPVGAPPGLPAPPGLARNASGSISNSSSSSSSTNNTPRTPAFAVPALAEALVGVTISESQEQVLYGNSGGDGDVAAANYAGEEYVADYELDFKQETCTIVSPTTEEEVVDNLWGSATDSKNDKPQEDEVICPIHVGKQCKKGICSARSDAEKAWKKEKARRERESAGPTRGGSAWNKTNKGGSGNGYRNTGGGYNNGRNNNNKSTGAVVKKAGDDGFQSVASKTRNGGRSNHTGGGGGVARSSSAASASSSASASASAHNSDSAPAAQTVSTQAKDDSDPWAT